MTETEEARLIKDAKNKYMKNWRNKNKDKVKKNNANYWKKYALKNKNCK